MAGFPPLSGRTFRSFCELGDSRLYTSEPTLGTMGKADDKQLVERVAECMWEHEAGHMGRWQDVLSVIREDYCKTAQEVLRVIDGYEADILLEQQSIVRQAEAGAEQDARDKAEWELEHAEPWDGRGG